MGVRAYKRSNADIVCNVFGPPTPSQQSSAVKKKTSSQIKPLQICTILYHRKGPVWAPDLGSRRLKEMRKLSDVNMVVKILARLTVLYIFKDIRHIIKMQCFVFICSCAINYLNSTGLLLNRLHPLLVYL